MVRARDGEFDAVVAMYHDQGHIALKLLGMHGAVNVTLGLPIVRTSVAHGTAPGQGLEGRGGDQRDGFGHRVRRRIWRIEPPSDHSEPTTTLWLR